MRNFFERINKNLKSNKGFSLVELIIVIAIMAVLIAVLAPQYTKYVERSRAQSDLTSFEELRHAIELACIDPANNFASTADITVTLSATSTTGYKTVGFSTLPSGVQTDVTSVIGDADTGTAGMQIACKSKTYAVAQNIVVDVDTDGTFKVTFTPAT